MCGPPAAAMKQTRFPAQSWGCGMKLVHRAGLWQQQKLHESKLQTKRPSAAFKPHCGRESIFDKHFAEDTN